MILQNVCLIIFFELKDPVFLLNDIYLLSIPFVFEIRTIYIF